MNYREIIIGAAALAALIYASEASAAGLTALGLDDPKIITPACPGTIIWGNVCWKPGPKPDPKDPPTRCEKHREYRDCHTDLEHDNHPEWPNDGHLGKETP